MVDRLTENAWQAAIWANLWFAWGINAAGVYHSVAKGMEEHGLRAMAQGQELFVKHFFRSLTHPRPTLVASR